MRAYITIMIHEWMPKVCRGWWSRVCISATNAFAFLVCRNNGPFEMFAVHPNGQKNFQKVVVPSANTETAQNSEVRGPLVADAPLSVEHQHPARLIAKVNAASCAIRRISKMWSFVEIVMFAYSRIGGNGARARSLLRQNGAAVAHWGTFLRKMNFMKIHWTYLYSAVITATIDDYMGASMHNNHILFTIVRSPFFPLEVSSCPFELTRKWQHLKSE